MHTFPKLAPMLLALLTLATTGAAWAAGGTYDEEDPLGERVLFEHFQELGGDLTQEHDLEFFFTFSDRLETRAEHAQRFANKLRRMGYPKAKAQPCADPAACWVVIAPKRMRLDLKKNIALSKELDQLAADEYGRYSGWDCDLFKQEDAMLLPPTADPNEKPTLAAWLATFDKFTTFRCGQLRESLAARTQAGATKFGEAFDARSMTDMTCTCMPERLTNLRSTLDAQALDATMTENEATETYMVPNVFEPCVAARFRGTYGEGCPNLVPASYPKTFCSCMQEFVNQMSDADLSQVVVSEWDYVEQEALAKKNGSRIPPPPPAYAKFRAREAACLK